MANQRQPLLGGIESELRLLAGEIGTMAEARLALARLELSTAIVVTRRFATMLALAAVMALVALSVSVVAMGEALHGVLGLPAWAWLAIIAAALGLLAAIGAWWAVVRFRREFHGLEETLEELHEDAIWIREWLGRENAAHTDAQD